MNSALPKLLLFLDSEELAEQLVHLGFRDGFHSSDGLCILAELAIQPCNLLVR